MPITSVVTPLAKLRVDATNIINAQQLTLTTATAAHLISASSDVVIFNGGTATGIASGVGVFQFASSVDCQEGQKLFVIMSGTGEGKLVGNNTTATGYYMFTATDQFSMFRFVGAKWRQVVAGATIATTT